MQKTYKIEIDCANCANKVEDAVKKIQGINSVSVNFMLLKMTVDFDDGIDEKKLIKEIKKTGQKVDDDFEIEC